MQKAEYRNQKKGMETGRTEEERSTGGTADRGEREEGKGKNGRPSSQNRAEADERKRSEGKARKREQKGSTGGTAVGAKPGGMKGNEQEAEYLKTEGKHGKPGREERGKPKKRKRKGRTGEAAVRRDREERGKEETEAE